MTPFNPTEAAATAAEPLMMAVKWYSGTERLDMREIAKALQAYTADANITVQTIELREEELWEVLYEPAIAPSSMGADAFTLTYTNGGVWLDDTDKMTAADGDRGTATYRKTVDQGGIATWTGTWASLDEPPLLATPVCTLSDALVSRQYREHLRAVRDSKFRNLILRGNPECLITGETDRRVLDAAHIYEVRHGGKDVIENGIVLRTDLHKLFDEHVLVLDANGTFKMNPMLASYEELFRKPKSIPERKVKFYANNIRARNSAREKKNDGPA